MKKGYYSFLPAENSLSQALSQTLSLLFLLNANGKEVKNVC